MISPVGHFDRAQSSEPLFAVGNVTQRSADDIEIDYSLPDQDVMRMIIMALTQGDVEEEAPQPSPQQRIRNITDAYIVPYNDDDVISMSTPRR